MRIILKKRYFCIDFGLHFADNLATHTVRTRRDVRGVRTMMYTIPLIHTLIGTLQEKIKHYRNKKTLVHCRSTKTLIHDTKKSLVFYRNKKILVHYRSKKLTYIPEAKNHVYLTKKIVC